MNNKIVVLLLIFLIGFVVAEDSDSSCPVGGAYVSVTSNDGIELNYKCIKTEYEGSFAWYYELLTGQRERVSDSLSITKMWIENGMNVDSMVISMSSGGLVLETLNNNIAMLSFVESDSYFESNNNFIKNITQKNLEENQYAYIRFNFTSFEIIEANLQINEDGSNLMINGKSFYALPFSRIVFKKGSEIEMELEDGYDASRLVEVMKIGDYYPDVSIEGSDLEISDDLTLINGKIQITQNGYLLEDGSVNYNQILFEADEDNQLFIANEDVNIEDYDGNWVRTNEYQLTMQSADNGIIQATILEDNDLLDSDDKDLTEIVIQDGDGLEITSRDSQGLISKVNHLSSEDGNTHIQNDGFGIEISDGGISIEEPDSIMDTDYRDKYQSLAMEITTDSSQSDEKLVISSYRQFAVVSDDTTLVSYRNDYDSIVSTLQEDNEIQTLEQLRELYPDIDFSVSNSNYMHNTLTEDTVPPYLLNAFNQYAEEHEDLTSSYGQVIFGNSGSSYTNYVYGTRGTLLMGIGTVDAYGGMGDIDTSTETFDHEYEHLKDELISEKEARQIVSSNNPKLESYINDLVELEDDLIGGEDITRTELSTGERNELLTAEFFLQWYNYAETGDMTLRFTYNKLLIDASENLVSGTTSSIALRKLDAVVDKVDSAYGSSKSSDLRAAIDSNSGIEIVTELYNIRNPGISDSGLSSLNSLIDDILENYVGLPSYYSALNYAEGYTDFKNAQYLELSSTFAQLSMEEKKQGILSSSSARSELFKKLAQVAFDAGKMDLDEYSYLMDEDCEDSDCIENRCVIYTMTCCNNYPDSPNC
jgi:hypothetical protein